MADQYDQRADLRVIMAKILTFDLENARVGVSVPEYPSTRCSWSD